jgi:ketosteroid isomerase-like protein
MPGTDVKLNADTITELFAATDRGDVEAVSRFFRGDVEVFFGNNEPIQGRAAYAALYSQVTGSLSGVRHEIHDVWHAAEEADILLARLTVHYTRLDGLVVSLPCCNVFRLDGGLIAQYRVYVDVGPVFSPAG